MAQAVNDAKDDVLDIKQLLTTAEWKEAERTAPGYSKPITEKLPSCGGTTRQ